MTKFTRLPLVRRGYSIIEADDRGGKAGRGCNKTTTIRVCESTGTGYCILKSFRYRGAEVGGRETAIAKAKVWVDQTMALK